MSDTRLRRLDALFAERVCGNKVRHIRQGEGYQFEGEWKYLNSFISHDDWYILAEGHRIVKCVVPYSTRSLDAAWEGTHQFAVVELFRGQRKVNHVEIEHPLGYENMADAEHPAEALVLACLLAVGCNEEELA